jgi:carbon storage regulator
MLVLTRKVADKVRIGDDIVVTVVEVGHGNVRLGIEAPVHVRVLRAELLDKALRDSARPPVTLTGP